MMQLKRRSSTLSRSDRQKCFVFNTKEILTMSKPLGYHTSYTPGDESFLEKVQEQYGSTFEKMTKREKLSILMILASNISAQLDGGVRGEIYDVARAMCNQLSLSDQAGIMEAIISQIRWGQNAELVHHT